MNTLPRCIAVFPEIKQVSQYMTECRVVVTMLTGNPSFPTPTPPLAQVSAHLNVLKESEEAACKRGKGAVAQRNVDLGLVRSDMRLLTAYVQSVADANVTESESLIKSAGLGIAKKSTRSKPPVEDKHGVTPGSVVLEAKALPRPVQYRWQMSTDQKSWTDLPETYKTRTEVDGLTPVAVYYFRLRTITKDGPSAFSTVVSIIVR